MRLESDGILISLRPFGDTDCVACVFMREYGLVTGMMRGAAVAKKNRPLVGQFGYAIWNARLDSQLGIFHWENTKNYSVSAMIDNKILLFMNSMFALIANLLPEREPYIDLYDKTINTLDNINRDSYLDWEICLLRYLGYALDLSRCSGCGNIDNLNFLSPRTGRAVCDVCAKPYLDRLYRLPLNLEITKRFIENICITQDIKIPQYRLMLKD